MSESMPIKELNAVFVASGIAARPVRLVKAVLGLRGPVRGYDAIDDRTEPNIDIAQHTQLLDGFARERVVLIHGLSEWSHHALTDTRSRTLDATAHLYASGKLREGDAAASCVITDSLERLDRFFPVKRENFEVRSKVRLIAVYGCAKGTMGRSVFESLIRQFHNLQRPDFLCFARFDEVAARLVAARIRTLV